MCWVFLPLESNFSCAKGNSQMLLQVMFAIRKFKQKYYSLVTTVHKKDMQPKWRESVFVSSR